MSWVRNNKMVAKEFLSDIKKCFNYPLCVDCYSNVFPWKKNDMYYLNNAYISTVSVPITCNIGICDRIKFVELENGKVLVGVDISGNFKDFCKISVSEFDLSSSSVSLFLSQISTARLGNDDSLLNCRLIEVIEDSIGEKILNNGNISLESFALKILSCSVFKDFKNTVKDIIMQSDYSIVVRDDVCNTIKIPNFLPFIFMNFNSDSISYFNKEYVRSISSNRTRHTLSNILYHGFRSPLGFAKIPMNLLIVRSKSEFIVV